MPQTGLTYYIDSSTGRITSMVNNAEALVQRVYKALDTERYGFDIYGWTYGLDLEPFIAQDLDYIQTNLQKYVEDCLLADDRIISVNNFNVQQQEIDSCLVTFDLDTTEGYITDFKKELNYGS